MASSRTTESVRRLHKTLEAVLGEVFYGVVDTGIVQWHDGHPTGGEEAAAAAVFAAHDPHTHAISPALVFLKGNDIHSVTLRIETDPEAETVTLDLNGETLPVDLVSGIGSIVITSDTPGDEIIVTGSGGALPGAEARIYVI